jgi:hypothetical protein
MLIDCLLCKYGTSGFCAVNPSMWTRASECNHYFELEDEPPLESLTRVQKVELFKKRINSSLPDKVTIGAYLLLRKDLMTRLEAKFIDKSMTSSLECTINRMVKDWVKVLMDSGILKPLLYELSDNYPVELISIS